MESPGTGNKSDLFLSTDIDQAAAECLRIGDAALSTLVSAEISRFFASVRNSAKYSNERRKLNRTNTNFYPGGENFLSKISEKEILKFLRRMAVEYPSNSIFRVQKLLINRNFSGAVSTTKAKQQERKNVKLKQERSVYLERARLRISIPLVEFEITGWQISTKCGNKRENTRDVYV